MMTAMKAYYDGTKIIPLQHYDFKPRQQFLIVVDENTDDITPAEEFMKLSWHGNESAEEMLAEIESGRKNSGRFGANHALFD